MSDASNARKKSALASLQQALTSLDASLKNYPDDDVFQELRERVAALHARVSTNWPLPENDEETARLNWYVVQNLDSYPEIAEAIAAACSEIIPD